MENTQTPDQINILRSNPSHQNTTITQILKETARILNYNPSTFIAIGALLIYPVSALHLSNTFIDQLIVKRITKSLLFISKSCGFQSNFVLNQSFQRISEISVSSMVSFPLQSTLFLVSKIAVVYSVEFTYSKKKFDSFKFGKNLYLIVRTIWRRIFTNYLLILLIIIGCITLFSMVLISMSKLLYTIGFSPNSIGYTCVTFGILLLFLTFLVFLAYVIMICDLSMVISIWEDVDAYESLVKARVLVTGQDRFGLMMFVGSTISMVIVKGLVEDWVKSLRCETECWRMWERFGLVVGYSFLVLVDFMMSSVFFFRCNLYSLDV